MATTSGFKQQCPSCEAMVPIKDAGLIGRKIDCPKCKYRFVVEDPGAAEDDSGDDVEEVAVAKKRKGGDADSGEGRRAASGKGAAVKSKAGPRRRRGDDDDDEEDQPRKARPKAGGGSNKGLLIGVGLGVVGLIAVGVVVILMMNSSGDDGTASGAGPRPSSRDRDPNPDAEKKDGEGKQGAPAATTGPGVAGDVTFTNLLPNDTEQVVNVKVTELLKTPLGRAVYDNPGMLRKETIQQKLGIPADDIERIVLGSSFSQGWSFNIVRTSKPIKMDAVKAALGLKSAPDGPIQQQEFFVLEGNAWLDNLSRQNPLAALQAGSVTPPKPGPMGVRLQDDQTLIFADMVPMKAFLTKKPEHMTKPAAAAPSGEGGQEGRPGAGGQGGTPPPPTLPSGMGGMGRGGMPGMPGVGGQPTEEAPPEPSAAYMTVKPEIKSMLDRVEAKGALISLATDSSRSINGLFQGLTKEWASGEAQTSLLNLLIKPQLDQVNVLGLSMHMKDGVTVMGGLEFKGDDIARRRHEGLQKALPQVARFLAEAFDLHFDVPAEQQGFPGMGPGMGPGMQGPGLQGPGGGGFTPPPGMGRQGGRRPGIGGGDDGPAGQPNPGEGQPSEPGKASSTIQTGLSEKTLVVTINFVLDAKAHDTFMLGYVRPALVKRRGMMDMAGAQPRAHELAAALKAYVDTKREFPRGTFERPVPSTRAGRPYPPADRVSWMADLLAFLPGQEDIQRRIDVKKSWRDKENLGAAITLVPHFLDPRSPQSGWWVRNAAAGSDVATTHFVGIAGIGLDAAEYKSDDPAVAGKMGIFGYDRVTTVPDVKDKLSETIALVQVPATYKRPWLAGGGATIMGVPETQSVKPFVTTQPDGKRGVLVIMGDGVVRFISENVTDDVFKAMCTIKGGEQVMLSRDTKVVPAPEPPADAEATPASPAAPPAGPATQPEPKSETPPK